MQAETVYTVAQTLPPGELERLIAMLQKEVKPVEVKKKRNCEEEQIPTKAEYYETVYKLLMDRKKRKAALRPPFKTNQ